VWILNKQTCQRRWVWWLLHWALGAQLLQDWLMFRVLCWRVGEGDFPMQTSLPENMGLAAPPSKLVVDKACNNGWHVECSTGGGKRQFPMWMLHKQGLQL
jgi:hypothetical protein